MRQPSQEPSLRAALAVQRRVVGALLRREFISLSGRTGSGFLFMLLEPTIFMLVLSLLFIYRGRLEHAQFSVAAFALSGYGIMWACRFQIFRSMGLISSNLPLFYHRNVRVLDVLIARSLIQAASVTVSFMSLFCLALFLNLFSFPEEFSLVVGSWFLVQWYGINLCLLTSAMGALYSMGTKLGMVINALHIVITGGLFMVEWLPVEYRPYALLFPMVHATEMMRDGFFNDFIPTHYDVWYVIKANIILTYFTLCMVLKYMKSEAAYGRD
ncbi:MAG: ABC transporter permease [Desulfovibrio sp.]|nr:ABC transporter permease [Desulfovibrio sp.]